MCWTCGCLRPDDLHNDPRNIVTDDLRAAAAFIGADIDTAIKNLKRTVKVYKPLAKAEAPTSTPVIRVVESDWAVCQVMKATDERRYTLGVAYPAMKADVGRAADGRRDFVSAEVLEETAWSWITKHRDIGLFHRSGTEGHATVVESYIYRGPKWKQTSPVDGKSYIIKSGDWLLGTIWDDHGWALVKSGLVRGWSPEGGAARATPSPERLTQLRSV